MRGYLIVSLTLLALVLSPSSTCRADLQADLATLKQASAVSAADPGAQAAWARLAASKADQLVPLLSAMKGASRSAENWLRSCIDAIAERELSAGRALPMKELHSFLMDRSGAPRARWVAYQWIVQVDPDAKQELLAQLLDDPSVDLRFEAVAQVLDRAEALPEDVAERRTLLQQALLSARDSSQLKQCAKSLTDLGQEVDLPGVLGYVKQWLVIGPFDNKGLKGFDVAYPPEKQIELTAEYDGMKGKVQWQEVAAQTESGSVDLVKELGATKEAISYAFTMVESAKQRQAELRYSSKNATKVWLNGKLIAANEVYHSGSSEDQYRATVQLNAGGNKLLVKVCQNEQSQPWEKEWDFKLRIVDAIGTPVVSQPEKVASK